MQLIRYRQFSLVSYRTNVRFLNGLFFKIPHTRFGMTNTLWGIIITITAFQTE